MGFSAVLLQALCLSLSLLKGFSCTPWWLPRLFWCWDWNISFSQEPVYVSCGEVPPWPGDKGCILDAWLLLRWSRPESRSEKMRGLCSTHPEHLRGGQMFHSYPMGPMDTCRPYYVKRLPFPFFRVLVLLTCVHLKSLNKKLFLRLLKKRQFH